MAIPCQTPMPVVNPEMILEVILDLRRFSFSLPVFHSTAKEKRIDEVG
jgi:hypothetical protein